MAPLSIIDDTAVPKFKQGVIISSPFLKFKTLVANIKAEEPELTIRPYLFENNLAILCSNLATASPICVVFFNLFRTAFISSLP